MAEQLTGSTAWHTGAADDVLAALAVDRTAGLSPDEAGRRLARYGPNLLVEVPREPR